MMPGMSVRLANVCDELTSFWAVEEMSYLAVFIFGYEKG
jgi:hypothetical protein